MKIWLLGVAVLGHAQAAWAQNADFTKFMEETNASVPAPSQDLIEADALETLRAIAEKDGQCVPTGVSLEAPTPATSASAVVQGVQSGQIKNAWMTYGTPKGCSSDHPTRFVVLQMPNGEVRARVVNQGRSIASMSLMRDASTSVAMAALMTIRNGNPSCAATDMAMLHTRVISTSSDLSPDFYGSRFAGVWDEGWTFKACGVSVEVPVSFQTDGNGGAHYNIKSSDIRVLN